MLLPTYRESKEYVLNVPPSPSLSARNMIRTYFRVTITVKDQMIKESAPRISARSGGLTNVEENTYKGEVPMSPYMTPTDS